MGWRHRERRVIGTFKHTYLAGKVAQVELTVDAEIIAGKLESLKAEVAEAVGKCLPYQIVHWFDVATTAQGLTKADRPDRSTKTPEKGTHEIVQGADGQGGDAADPKGAGIGGDVPERKSADDDAPR